MEIPHICQVILIIPCLTSHGSRDPSRGTHMSRKMHHASRVKKGSIPRGNPGRAHRTDCRQRSIPVYTGKPDADVGGKVNVRVYPRTHGETRHDKPKWALQWGLSPYTRGNRDRGAVRVPGRRSIPVHTGKPDADIFQKRNSGVYPRTHGETCLSAQGATLG